MIEHGIVQKVLTKIRISLKVFDNQIFQKSLLQDGDNPNVTLMEIDLNCVSLKVPLIQFINRP